MALNGTFHETYKGALLSNVPQHLKKLKLNKTGNISN